VPSSGALLRHGSGLICTPLAPPAQVVAAALALGMLPEEMAEVAGASPSLAAARAGAGAGGAAPAAQPAGTAAGAPPPQQQVDGGGGGGRGGGDWQPGPLPPHLARVLSAPSATALEVHRRWLQGLPLMHAGALGGGVDLGVRRRHLGRWLGGRSPSSLKQPLDTSLPNAPPQRPCSALTHPLPPPSLPATPQAPQVLGYLADVLAARGPAAGNPQQLASDAELSPGTAAAVRAALAAHGAKGLWAVKAALPEEVGFATIKVVAALEALGALPCGGGGGGDGAQGKQQQGGGSQQPLATDSQPESSFSFPAAPAGAAAAPGAAAWAPGVVGAGPPAAAPRRAAGGGEGGGGSQGSVQMELSMASLASQGEGAQLVQPAQQQPGGADGAQPALQQQQWERWPPRPASGGGSGGEAPAAAAAAAAQQQPARKRALPGSLAGAAAGGGGASAAKRPHGQQQEQAQAQQAAAAAAAAITEATVLSALAAAGGAGASAQLLLARLGAAPNGAGAPPGAAGRRLAEVLSGLVGEAVFMRGPRASDAGSLEAMLDPELTFCLL
jgi:hypothetical protein